MYKIVMFVGILLIDIPVSAMINENSTAWRVREARVMKAYEKIKEASQEIKKAHEEIERANEEYLSDAPDAEQREHQKKLMKSRL
jgi:hypothetical protein